MQLLNLSINAFQNFSSVTLFTALVETQLDSIEKLKADLPENIIENKDDLTFIQPDVNSM